MLVGETFTKLAKKPIKNQSKIEWQDNSYKGLLFCKQRQNQYRKGGRAIKMQTKHFIIEMKGSAPKIINNTEIRNILKKLDKF